jgi:hypothetical protein
LRTGSKLPLLLDSLGFVAAFPLLLSAPPLSLDVTCADASSSLRAATASGCTSCRGFRFRRWDLSFFMSASLTGFRKNSSAPSSRHLKFFSALSPVQVQIGVAFLRRVERALRLPAFFPFGLPLRALPRSPWNLRTPPPLGLQLEARYAV